MAARLPPCIASKDPNQLLDYMVEVFIQGEGKG